MSNYTQEPAFINRKQELAFLHDRIAKRPNEILFLCGPKSSGKTTLLYKFIEEIQQEKIKKYDVKHFNLREMMVVNYSDFVRTFFLTDRSHGQAVETKIAQSLAVNLHFFNISSETENLIREQRVDPFHIMKEELQKLAAKNIRPIIIVDELQALEGIYMNGQRELLKEVFNFFVAMTKESHLCHIIIASSDGYFLQRIYDDSKLKKTSSFFEVDYLTKEDTVCWLNNLEKESAIKEYVLSEKQIEMIWDFWGGSCWEVNSFLGDLQYEARDGKIADDVIARLLEQQKQNKLGLFEFYVTKEKQSQLFFAIDKLVQKSPKFKAANLFPLLDKFYTKDELKEELYILVKKNFLAFQPATTEFSLQGRCMEVGLAMYAETLKPAR